MAQDFYCIKESKEEEEDDIINDEEIKSAKQGRSFKLQNLAQTLWKTDNSKHVFCKIQEKRGSTVKEHTE